MLIPLILSGGSGTRLWPVSRRNLPKQFLSLAGHGTLFQQTIARTRAQLSSRAVVPMLTRSDPVPGSVLAMEVMHSPLMNPGIHVVSCPVVP